MARALVRDLKPGDRFDDGYPNGTVTVRWVDELPSGNCEIGFGIREDDVQGTLYFLSNEVVELV